MVCCTHTHARVVFVVCVFPHIVLATDTQLFLMLLLVGCPSVVNCYQAELQVGDIILRVDDTLINSGKDLAAATTGKTYMQVRPVASSITSVNY